MTIEPILSFAIQQSVNPKLSSNLRKQWFDVVRILHFQRSQETIKKMEANL